MLGPPLLRCLKQPPPPHPTGQVHFLNLMANFVDSEAEFKRCTELVLQALYGEAIKTFGTLAFAVADQPDRVDEAQVKSLTTRLSGDNPTLGIQAGVKRLAFEGLTHSLQDLKLRSDPDASSTGPLPTLEREAKRSNQETRLTGILIEGELEPSHALVDKAAAMLQDGVVRYIPPSACVSRDTELASGKRDQDFVSLEGGTLSIKRRDDHRLQQAFTRRGLALDRVNVLDLHVHERAMRQLFHLAARPTPSGYDKPTVWHIIRADKELWTLVARSCRSGCKPDSSGTRPLDDLIKTTVSDPLVVLHLMPLATRGRPEPRTERPPPKGKGAKDGKGDRSRAAPPNRPKGKGKGKDKKGASAHTRQPSGRPAMPREHRDLDPTDAKGNRRCYGFNLDEGCSLPASGNPPECDRGLHVCMNCGSKEHGAQQCPSRKAA